MLILLIPVKFNVDYGSCEKLEFRTIPSLLRGYLKISLFQIPGLNFIYLYYESNYVSIWRCRAWKSSPGHWKHTSTAMATAWKRAVKPEYLRCCFWLEFKDTSPSRLKAASLHWNFGSREKDCWNDWIIINLENRRCSEGTHCGEVLEEGSSEEIRYGWLLH